MILLKVVVLVTLGCLISSSSGEKKEETKKEKESGDLQTSATGPGLYQIAAPQFRVSAPAKYHGGRNYEPQDSGYRGTLANPAEPPKAPKPVQGGGRYQGGTRGQVLDYARNPGPQIVKEEAYSGGSEGKIISLSDLGNIQGLEGLNLNSLFGGSYELGKQPGAREVAPAGDLSLTSLEGLTNAGYTISNFHNQLANAGFAAAKLTAHDTFRDFKPDQVRFVEAAPAEPLPPRKKPASSASQSYRGPAPQQGPSTDYYRPGPDYQETPQAQFQAELQYDQNPGAQYSSAPRSQYKPEPSPQYQQAPQAQYKPGPSAQYQPGPSAQYQPGPSAQYQPGPSAQYQPGPSAQYQPGPSAQYGPGPTESHGPAPESSGGPLKFENLDLSSLSFGTGQIYLSQQIESLRKLPQLDLSSFGRLPVSVSRPIEKPSYSRPIKPDPSDDFRPIPGPSAPPKKQRKEFQSLRHLRPLQEYKPPQSAQGPAHASPPPQKFFPVQQIQAAPLQQFQTLQLQTVQPVRVQQVQTVQPLQAIKDAPIEHAQVAYGGLSGGYGGHSGGYGGHSGGLTDVSVVSLPLTLNGGGYDFSSVFGNAFGGAGLEEGGLNLW